jgi:hypothetical protein
VRGAIVTVRELIAKLQRCDQDAVVIANDDGRDFVATGDPESGWFHVYGERGDGRFFVDRGIAATHYGDAVVSAVSLP